MSDTGGDQSDPRMRAALAEIQGMIHARYPTATFAVAAGEDPEGIYLTATVDLDDPDEVMDLVVGRLLELEDDEGLPLYLIPVRTPERVAALLAGQSEDLSWPERSRAREA